MRRILITGATGFVGRHAAVALRARFGPGAVLHGLARKAGAVPLPEGVVPVPADLADRRAVAAILRDLAPTDILHLAAQASVAGGAARPLAAWEANVGNLIILAEAILAQCPAANLFFVSSGEVYGRAFLPGQPVSEAVPPAPVGPYATTKRVGEQLLTDVLGAAAGRLVILRPFTQIGPGQDERFAVASFAAQIARIEAGLTPPVLEVGNLAARRDILDVRDVAEAYADLVAAADGLDKTSLYNICSGRARAIESVLSGLAALARARFEVRIAPDRLRPSEIPIACGDAAALASAIGWRPRRVLDETLADVLDDARARLGRG
ncbi:NAD-dependent epimerase/dehydratase family protein [Methylobacterium sp. JK268]